MGRNEGHLDPDSGSVSRFAGDLRELREMAGRPSYRQLAKLAHYSVTTLSQAASGNAMPSLDVTLAYVRACGGDERAWQERWHAVSAELACQEENRDLADSPYLGQATFQRDDADRFFGRDQLVRELCHKVSDSPFLAVVGPSGSGKSSLLRAGLLPAIARGDVPGGASWPIMLVTPGSRPIDRLAARLATADVASVPPAGEPPVDTERLRMHMRRALATRPDRAQLLIVIDQFEEIFTLCLDVRQRSRFIEWIVAATAEWSGQVRVILGIRADFLRHCARYPALVAALRDRRVLVGPIAHDDLRAVVREPATSVGGTVEATLTERILADAGNEPGALALMSQALLETWKRCSGNTMTLAGYLRAGGVRGAVVHTADLVYSGLDTHAQSIVRDLLLRLTAVGEDMEDTRRRVWREELLRGSDRDAVAAVLSRLVTARLVISDEETVEVAHEMLIRSWPRLRSWLAEDRDIVLATRRLTEAAAEWERHGRDESLLYRGARLTAWQDRELARLNDDERQFLTVSRNAVVRESRKRRRRIRWMIGLGTVTAAVAFLAVLTVVLVR